MADDDVSTSSDDFKRWFEEHSRRVQAEQMEAGEGDTTPQPGPPPDPLAIQGDVASSRPGVAELPGIMGSDPRMTGADRREPVADPRVEASPEEMRRPPPDPYGAIGGADLLGESRRSQARLEDLRRQREEQLEPLYASAMESINQPRPQVPELRRQPVLHSRDFSQNLFSYAQDGMMLGLIAGAFNRRHVTTALNAAGSYMQGAHEGELEKAKIALEDWKAASEATVRDNQAMMDQYNAILKSQKMDMDQKMNAVQLVATKWGDDMRYEMAASKNITEVARSLNTLQWHNMQFAQKAQQIDLLRQRLQDQKEAREGGRVSDELANFLGEQLAAGAPPSSVLTNLGRGAQGAENILKVRTAAMHAAQVAGMSPADMSKMQQEFLARGAGLRTAYTQEARMATAAEEAKTTFPMARDARAVIADVNVTGANRLLQGWNSGTGSPEQARLIVATLSASNAYAAVMNRGGSTVTVDARAHAEKLLDIAYSRAAYNAALDQMEKEMNAVLKAPERSRARLMGKTPPEPDATKPPPDTRDPMGYFR